MGEEIGTYLKMCIYSQKKKSHTYIKEVKIKMLWHCYIFGYIKQKNYLKIFLILEKLIPTIFYHNNNGFIISTIYN